MSHAWSIAPKNAPDANIVAAELDRLAAMNGGAVNPAIVLDAARSPDSPLHEMFEWDDTEAAERWRLHQARTIIVNLRIVLDTAEDEPRRLTVRAYPALTAGQANDYRSIAAVVRDPARYAQLVALGKRRLREFREMFASIAEFAEVIRSIDRAIGDERTVG